MKKKLPINSKHDYDDPVFYDTIEEQSRKGFTDRNIAHSMNLTPEVFSRMKSGKYENWEKEDNARRGELITQALARGRDAVNLIIRDKYLKTALGGQKTKTVMKRYVERRCVCQGSDDDCPMCGGEGSIILTDKAVMHETDIELAPNMQALATWLFNHDPEWRESVIAGKKLDITTGGKEINERPLVFMSASELSKEQMDDILKGEQKDNDTTL